MVDGNDFDDDNYMGIMITMVMVMMMMMIINDNYVSDDEKSALPWLH